MNRGDLVVELRRVLPACLRALETGDYRAARELADQAEFLAANIGVLASANAALVAGKVDRAVGDDATAEDTFARAADLAGRHLAAADGIQIFLQARIELAGVYRMRGDCPRAERVLLDALACSVRGWPEPRDLARLYNELGQVSAGLGDFGQAANSYRCARSILEGSLPVEICELASVYRNMGALARARGDHQAAQEPARRAVSARERAPGPQNSDAAADCVALAFVLLNLGRLDEAEQLLRKAVPVLEGARGGPHPDHPSSLGLLAVIAHKRGHHLAAHIFYRRVLDILQQGPDRDNRDLVVVLAGLAALYQTLGAHARADALEARAQAILAGQLRPRPADTRAHSEGAGTICSATMAPDPLLIFSGPYRPGST